MEISINVDYLIWNNQECRGILSHDLTIKNSGCENPLTPFAILTDNLASVRHIGFFKSGKNGKLDRTRYWYVHLTNVWQFCWTICVQLSIYLTICVQLSSWSTICVQLSKYSPTLSKFTHFSLDKSYLKKMW